MPYRTLEEAALRPLPPETNRRTIPRAALVMTLAAQVFIWSAAVVNAWTILLYYQQMAEKFDLTTSVPVDFILAIGSLLRGYVWLVVVGMLIAALAEAWYFFAHQPFVVSKRLWLSWLLLTLILPCGVLIIGSLIMLEPILSLLRSLA